MTVADKDKRAYREALRLRSHSERLDAYVCAVIASGKIDLNSHMAAIYYAERMLESVDRKMTGRTYTSHLFQSTPHIVSAGAVDLTISCVYCGVVPGKEESYWCEEGPPDP